MEKADASEEEIAKGESVHSKKITDTKTDLLLSKHSPQSEVMAYMHRMTHQKIQANEKWRATPMVQENIDIIFNLLQASEFEDKDVLLQIASRWKEGDFSRVDKDHNTIWRMQGGTIGEAYGIMTVEEERWFILNNFDDDILNVWLEENK